MAEPAVAPRERKCCSSVEEFKQRYPGRRMYQVRQARANGTIAVLYYPQKEGAGAKRPAVKRTLVQMIRAMSREQAEALLAQLAAAPAPVAQAAAAGN